MFGVQIHSTAIVASLLFAVIVSAGQLWSWCCPPPAGLRDKAFGNWFWTLAVSVVAGITIALVIAYVSSSVGYFRTGIFWVIVLAVAAQGFAIARNLRHAMRWSVIVAAGLCVLVLLLLPARGAWMLGGWDPGVYANEGANVARTGSFSSAPVAFYQQLGPDLMRTLTKDWHSHRELFPGVPLDIERSVITLEYPRLTSVAFALVGKLGGLAIIWRTPLLTAAAAWLIWSAYFCGRFRAGPAALCSALVLGLQPVFLYHSHTPSSELLELLLVGALLLVRASGATNTARAALTALLLLAAGANRTSFLLFGSLWLGLIAWGDLERADRGRVLLEHAVLALALALGAAAHHVLTPIAAAKLTHVLPRIEMFAARLYVAVLALDLIALRPAWRRLCAAWAGPLLRAALLAGILCAIAFALRKGTQSALNTQAIGTYLGWPLVALAGLGLVAAAVRIRDSESLLPLIWAIAATLVVFDNKHVAELYPWATKRYLAFTVPLIAMGIGSLLDSAWNLRQRWFGRMAAAAVVAAAAFFAPRSAQAWRNTSYDSIPPVMAEAAQQLEGADGVVADHFTWGTPLALAWGCPVVNGVELWTHPDVDSTRAVWQRLSEMARNGRRILVLTSTERGNEIWGPDAPAMRQLWSSGPVTYRETVHQKRQRGFVSKERTREFRVYVLEPGPGS